MGLCLNCLHRCHTMPGACRFCCRRTGHGYHHINGWMKKKKKTKNERLNNNNRNVGAGEWKSERIWKVQTHLFHNFLRGREFMKQKNETVLFSYLFGKWYIYAFIWLSSRVICLIFSHFFFILVRSHSCSVCSFVVRHANAGYVWCVWCVSVCVYAWLSVIGLSSSCTHRITFVSLGEGVLNLVRKCILNQICVLFRIYYLFSKCITILASLRCTRSACWLLLENLHETKQIWERINVVRTHGELVGFEYITQEFTRSNGIDSERWHGWWCLLTQPVYFFERWGWTSWKLLGTRLHSRSNFDQSDILSTITYNQLRTQDLSHKTSNAWTLKIRSRSTVSDYFSIIKKKTISIATSKNRNWLTVSSKTF